MKLLGFVEESKGRKGKPAVYGFVAWCLTCRIWHRHGTGKEKPAIGDLEYRVPHCTRSDESSYAVEIVGDVTPEILRDLERRRPHGPRPDVPVYEGRIAEKPALSIREYRELWR